MNLKVIESRLNFIENQLESEKEKQEREVEINSRLAAIEGQLASEKEKNDKENVPMNKTREFDSTVKIPPVKVDYEEYKKKRDEIMYNTRAKSTAKLKSSQQLTESQPIHPTKAKANEVCKPPRFRDSKI